MKVKKIKRNKYKLLKLHILKSQVYLTKSEKNHFENLLNLSIEQIEPYLKKALKVIYEYHINRCQILFIGFPKLHNKKFLNISKQTNHFFIPNSIWINGLFCNKLSILRYLKLKYSKKNILQSKNIKVLLNLKKKPDLIVIYNQNLELNALNESYKLGIPIISFNNSFFYNFKTTYKAPGNYIFEEKKIQNIYNLLIYSILKRKLKKPYQTKPKIPVRMNLKIDQLVL